MSKRKHFAKAAKPLRGRKERHGYVILVSNEPRCCHAATSERRRIRLKADYYYIALRGASIRRSQRGNSEAAFFRGTLPRRTASGARGVVMTKLDRHFVSVAMQRIVCPLYLSHIFDFPYNFPTFLTSVLPTYKSACTVTFYLTTVITFGNRTVHCPTDQSSDILSRSRNYTEITTSDYFAVLGISDKAAHILVRTADRVVDRAVCELRVCRFGT